MEQLDASTEPDYGQSRPRRSDRPPRSDRAEINALLAAFGSSALTFRIESWAEAVKQFDEEHERLAFEWQQNIGDPNEPIDGATLEGLRSVLRFKRRNANKWRRKSQSN